MPAHQLIRRLLAGLRPILDSTGDWELVTQLTDAALARGISAARQRAVCASGGLPDVVDALVAETRAGTDWQPGAGPDRTTVSATLRGHLPADDKTVLFDSSAAQADRGTGVCDERRPTGARHTHGLRLSAANRIMERPG